MPQNKDRLGEIALVFRDDDILSPEKGRGLSAELMEGEGVGSEGDCLVGADL